MPGHPIPANEAIVNKTKADVAKLEALIEEHDVVFLLMDSRESRWLPTLIGAAKNKVCSLSLDCVLQVYSRAYYGSWC